MTLDDIRGFLHVKARQRERAESAPQPEVLPTWSYESPRGRLYGQGKDAAEAWDSMGRDWKLIVAKAAFVKGAKIYEQWPSRCPHCKGMVESRQWRASEL